MNLAEIAAQFQANIAELKAALNPADKTYILAWDNGLCVCWATPDFNKPGVCGPIAAETVATPDMPEEAWAFTPNVINGHGERAKVLPRQYVLERSIAELEALAAKFLVQPDTEA